jgi:[protein-PII] uridylyltransferase
MPIQTTVNIKPDSNSNNHSLEIITGDRPGLLSIVAHLFLKHNIDLQTAKINTLGKRAEDSFLISKAKGVTLTEAEVIELKQSIIDNLIQ